MAFASEDFGILNTNAAFQNTYNLFSVKIHALKKRPTKGRLALGVHLELLAHELPNLGSPPMVMFVHCLLCDLETKRGHTVSLDDIHPAKVDCNLVIEDQKVAAGLQYLREQ